MYIGKAYKLLKNVKQPLLGSDVPNLQWDANGMSYEHASSMLSVYLFIYIRSLDRKI